MNFLLNSTWISTYYFCFDWFGISIIIVIIVQLLVLLFFIILLLIVLLLFLWFVKPVGVDLFFNIFQYGQHSSVATENNRTDALWEKWSTQWRQRTGPCKLSIRLTIHPIQSFSPSPSSATLEHWTFRFYFSYWKLLEFI